MDLYALLLLVYRMGQVVIPINVWEDLFNISFQLKYSREVYQVWTFQRLIFFFKVNITNFEHRTF